MTSSGRCHGPGCTQTADGDFCSEVCQNRWNRQAVGLCKPDCRCPQCNEEITWAQLRAEVERGGEQAFYTEPGERRPGEVEVVVSINQPAVRRAYRRLTEPVATIDIIRRDEDGWHVTGRWLPIGSGDASPQVASIPDPARGWLARAFDRLFGRTT